MVCFDQQLLAEDSQSQPKKKTKSHFSKEFYLMKKEAKRRSYIVYDQRTMDRPIVAEGCEQMRT